ncbi:unnamed protein product [Protopolystoma xenopodis]|uniref:Uncharacterized protein n=1 Tax=Protopolystoma xenopodis TaxID=117903 RepID=A0A3S5B1Z8_9PLAT|nr:unnamed protein product [Protopolystoma xenopodis]
MPTTVTFKTISFGPNHDELRSYPADKKMDIFGAEKQVWYHFKQVHLVLLIRCNWKTLSLSSSSSKSRRQSPFHSAMMYQMTYRSVSLSLSFTCCRQFNLPSCRKVSALPVS